MSHTLRHLTRNDLPMMQSLCEMFGVAFNDLDTYTGKPPDATYLRSLLGSDTFIALAALKDDVVVGGIAAYQLRKFEQARSEIYLYDLAVLEAQRREGIATALIEALKRVAAALT